MRPKLRLACALFLWAALGAAHSEPATEAFAGAQLDAAQATLLQAQAAFAARDYVLARRLAAQAGLDARLAWGMTDSAPARQAAARLARQAERMRGAAQNGAAGLVAGGLSLP